MLIGIDARPLLPPLTGIGQYLLGFLETLQRKDTENRYLLFCHQPLNFPIFNNRWRVVHGGRKRRLQANSWFQTVVPRHARRLDLDLFWAPRHHLPLGLPRRTASLVTVHDLVHRRHPGTMSIPNLLLERFLMGPSLRRADRVTTVSRATERELLRFYPRTRGKVRTVSPGIPAFPAEARNVVLPPVPYFLVVGTLEPRKNLARAIEAFRGMETGGKPLHLVVVGGGGWKRRSLDASLWESPGGTRRIHALGYVPRPALPTLYRNAVGLVFPSLYEGFGFPILEAMSLGTPVITSDRSSMPEVAGRAALTVNPFRIDSIRRAMERLLNSSERERYARLGRNRAGDFSRDRSAARMLALFHETAGRKAARE